jgi:hypothetical protein
MLAEDVVRTFRGHYDSIAKKLNKPILTDDELVEDVMVHYWAWFKKEE